MGLKVDKLQELTKTWGRMSERYHSLTLEETGFDPKLYPMPKKGDLVLDLGCGAGTHLRALAEHSKNQPIGVDLSFEMLAFARKESCCVVCSDVRHLPFMDGSFNYIWSNVVISCLYDWPRAVSEMGRVLSPSGIGIVIAANSLSMLTIPRLCLQSVGKYSLGRIYHISPRKLAATAEQNRLRVLDWFTLPKQATARGTLAGAIYAGLSGADSFISRLIPDWGGDSVVIFTKD
jgi:SAM-dependent methyltransferase